MAVPFTQLVATTYDDVVNAKNQAADNWSDSSALKALEAKGGVERRPGGSTLKLTLDYQANAGADFLATDSTATSTTKTEVITSAGYDYIPLVVPVNWTLTDEALNSEPSQKIDLVKAIVRNALRSHDQAIETALFAATATDGFESLPTINTNDGTGTIGEIVSGTETWWKNSFKDYTDASALLADMRTLYNSCSKGSMGSQPNVILTDDTNYGVYEGKLVANQRYNNADKAQGSFKGLMFANAEVIFSVAGTESKFFFINTEFLKLYAVKSAWRSRQEITQFTDAAMKNMKVFSVVQLATSARSRGGVLFT